MNNSYCYILGMYNDFHITIVRKLGPEKNGISDALNLVNSTPFCKHRNDMMSRDDVISIP